MNAHGAEYSLSAGSARAVITAVGAGIRQLSVDGVDLTPGYSPDLARPYYAGAVLVPWPNRIRDGVWFHNGRLQQLDLTEPERRNALHGLLSFTAYEPIARDDSSITLAANVFPQHGYPFPLATAVSYTLSSSGLNVTHSVTNTGHEPAPVAIGAHPFLGIGDIRSADLTLTVSADTHIDVDDRLNPVGSSPVRDSHWDLRAGRPVADLDLDDSWTDLHIVDGGSTHTLRAPDGRAVSLWADEQFGYVHAFITRRFPVSGGFVTAVALEPMTAPADAFNSGENLQWVQPEATWSASWAIRYC